MRMPAELVSGEASLSGLQVALFLLGLTWFHEVQREIFVVSSSSDKDTSSYQMKTLHYDIN